MSLTCLFLYFRKPKSWRTGLSKETWFPARPSWFSDRPPHPGEVSLLSDWLTSASHSNSSKYHYPVFTWLFINQWPFKFWMYLRDLCVRVFEVLVFEFSVYMYFRCLFLSSLCMSIWDAVFEFSVYEYLRCFFLVPCVWVYEMLFLSSLCMSIWGAFFEFSVYVYLRCFFCWL